MAKYCKGAERRTYIKEMSLNSSELKFFEAAQKQSGLSTGDFMRQRCLRIVKHRQISLSQIQVYQQLSLLQQQGQEILEVLGEQSMSSGRTLTRGGDFGQLGDGEGRPQEWSEADDLRWDGQQVVELVKRHLESIVELRRQIVRLDEPMSGLGSEPEELAEGLSGDEVESGMRTSHADR